MIDKLSHIGVTVFTIAVVGVLVGLGKVDATAGLTLIATLAGGHAVGGALNAQNATSVSREPPADQSR